FKDKIEKIHYGVIEEKAELYISGMTCAACAKRIEKGIGEVEGVSNATVNVALLAVTLSYNYSIVQHRDMISEVKKLVYELRHKDDGPEKVDHKQAEIRIQTLKFIFSAILTLPLLWTMVAHFSFLSFIYLPDIFMNPWFQLVLATPVQFIIG